MPNFKITPSKISGEVTIPSSKSHTLRAIYFAALAEGTSRIDAFLPSPDAIAMIDAVRLIGAEVKIDRNSLEIRGVAGKPHAAKDVIQCGNSGQVLRFIGALAGLMPSYTVITGDASIREKRPVKPLLEGLKQLGVFAESTLGNGYAPLIIKGPLKGNSATIDGEDSQPVSGFLMAGAFAPHPIELRVNRPGEKPWIDLTLYWLHKLGIAYTAQNYSYYRMEGNAKLKAFNYHVPGDFSTAAFPIAAAIISRTQVTLNNIDMQDCQGDKAIIPLLQKMGVSIAIDSGRNTLTVNGSDGFKGAKMDINDFVDALPILAVLGCFADGRTEITNAAIARHKESDRVHSIAVELKKMGARIEERPDGLIIEPSELHGAHLATYHDHRMGMALTIAAMGAKTSSTVIDVKCIDKTYPDFYVDFKRLGAKIEMEDTHHGI